MFSLEEKRTPLLLAYDLQLFANDEGGEKTEEPTAKKIEDSRKEGQVAKSKELTSAAMLLAFFLCLRIFMSFIGERLVNVFPYFWRDIANETGDGFTHVRAWQIVLDTVQYIAITIAPFVIFAFVIAFLSQRIQITWKVTSKPMEPKLNKLSPISGFKRMFSKQSLFELVLSIFKIVVFSAVAYSVVKDNVGIFVTAYDLTIQDCLGILFDMVMELGIKISVTYLALALGDWVFQKWKHKKDLRMTKQEVKDEYKQTEGNPEIKNRIKSLQRQMASSRMMQKVPQADVIIRNPTHVAIALKYDPDHDNAPVVLAKGLDELALRIVKVGEENNVYTIENKPLARAMYNSCELDRPIPSEFYTAVAEILVYLYKQDNGKNKDKK